MSLILCPECGAKISNKATMCPHCGFVSDDNSQPISVQDTYKKVPNFSYDIEEWNPNGEKVSLIAYEDNRTLVKYLGNWQNIQLRFPAIANIIKSLAEKDSILVAKMDSYVKKLIEKGVYRFTIDKRGEILPTIRDTGGIVKQVRLEEIAINPELANSLSNLQTHAAMAQILDEIEYVGDAIRGIHIELQNDRIALAESTKDKLLLTSRIQDTKLREIALLNVVNSATEAKRILMRNFAENLNFIAEHSQKSDIQLLMEGKKGRDIPQKVADAFQALVSITNSVQIECQGYALLGEYEASKESLLQFKRFIEENKLDDRDTLILLNENTPLKKMKIVNEFVKIANNITTFDTAKQLSGYSMDLITEVPTNEESKE